MSDLNESVIILSSDSEEEFPDIHLIRGRRNSMQRQGGGDQVRGRAQAPAQRRQSQSVVQPQRTNIAGSSSGPQPKTNTNDDIGHMECVVCMENLLRPAEVTNEGGSAGGNNQRPIPQNLPPTKKRAATALAKIDPSEICAASCGHMFHKYCIQKWFNNEQGGGNSKKTRTCPSCRKNVNAKLTHLMPTMGQDDDDGPPLRRSSSIGTQASSSLSEPLAKEKLLMHQTMFQDHVLLKQRYKENQKDLNLRNCELVTLQEKSNRQAKELQELQASQNVQKQRLTTLQERNDRQARQLQELRDELADREETVQRLRRLYYRW